MTADVFQAISTQGAAVNLSSRAKFRLTGGDRIRYLNGQVTNDVRRVKTDATLYACVTDVKGRIAGDVFIHATDDALFLNAEPGLRETLGLRLERYIVADDAELTDVTDEWQLWHVWGSTTDTPVCRERGIDGQECPSYSLLSTRFGIAGTDLWLPAGTAYAPACHLLSDDDLETWRILQKVPRWPSELNAETFPPEAGIQEQAMDFAKGCYIGQEVLSRIKTTGKMPRELIAFESEAEVNAGDEICFEKAVGKVTSVTKHPVTGRTLGLGMVKKGTSSDSLTIAGAPLKRR